MLLGPLFKLIGKTFSDDWIPRSLLNEIQIASDVSQTPLQTISYIQQTLLIILENIFVSLINCLPLKVWYFSFGVISFCILFPMNLICAFVILGWHSKWDQYEGVSWVCQIFNGWSYSQPCIFSFLFCCKDCSWKSCWAHTGYLCCYWWINCDAGWLVYLLRNCSDSSDIFIALQICK